MTDPATGATPFDVLLDRLRQGDEDAARELIDRFGEAVRREIRFRLRDSRLHRVVGDSDVFQSAVSRFLWGLRLGKFDVASPQEMLALLRTIAERRVCRAARFWRAQRRDLQRTGDLADVSDTALIAADPTPSKAVSEQGTDRRNARPPAGADPADGPVAAGGIGLGGNRGNGWAGRRLPNPRGNSTSGPSPRWRPNWGWRISAELVGTVSCKAKGLNHGSRE